MNMEIEARWLEANTFSQRTLECETIFVIQASSSVPRSGSLEKVCMCFSRDESGQESYFNFVKRKKVHIF